jgi:ferredoxin
MPDDRVMTGSLADLAVDASRCLPMRFCDSSCRRCVECCPHGAISLAGGLAVDPQRCRGCLSCTAVCPVGALEPQDDLFAALARLSRASLPVLGCLRTGETAQATLACLGGLSEESLLVLCQTAAGNVTLDLSRCGECPNRPAVEAVRRRAQALTDAGLCDGGCPVVMAETPAAIPAHASALDRRSFFRSFGTALFKSADNLLAKGAQPSSRKAGYGEKRVPARRQGLNRLRAGLPRGLDQLVGSRFDVTVAFTAACTCCQGCVAICPTGALQGAAQGDLPRFVQSSCTGCGLCREFCAEGALRIEAEGGEGRE